MHINADWKERLANRYFSVCYQNMGKVESDMQRTKLPTVLTWRVMERALDLDTKELDLLSMPLLFNKQWLKQVEEFFVLWFSHLEL